MTRATSPDTNVRLVPASRHPPPAMSGTGDMRVETIRGENRASPPLFCDIESFMACDVHDDNGWAWRWIVLAAGLIGATACGPVEPEPPEPNRAPYIPPDRVRPDRRLVDVDTLNGGVVELEVTELLDPNDENQLFYAWIGDQRGIQRVGNVDSVDTTRINGDSYHTFQAVNLRINPCDVVGTGTRHETIWLYVSDRRFEDVSNDRAVPRTGAFVVSRTWVLAYAPQICTD